MPPTPPRDPFPHTVLVRGCGSAGPYADGLYELSDLTLPADVADPRAAALPLQRLDGDVAGARAEDALARAEYLVVKPGCDPGIDSMLPISFRMLAPRGDLRLWARPPR